MLNRWYRYNPPNFLQRQILTIAVAVVLGGLFIIGLAARAIAPALARPALVMTLPLLVFLTVPLGAMAFTTADYRTDDTGLEVNVMGLFRKKIPWEALRYTSVWDVAPPRYVSVFLLRRWQNVHAVYIPGLNGFSVVGIFFGLGQSSVLVITPDHDNGDHLIDRLKHMQHPMSRKKPRIRRWRE